MELTPEEINLVRQWFDAVQDLNPAYLGKEDYSIANRLYEAQGMRVPDRNLEGAMTRPSWNKI